MELTVSTWRGATQIARAIAAGNPTAARTYLDKFELRRSIEQAAVNGLNASLLQAN